jgi:hypothetical protein
MYQISFFIFLFLSQVSFGQNNDRDYEITIAGYQHLDTIPKQVMLSSAYIAEAVDDFGFEIVLRGKYIVKYSIKLFNEDSLLIQQNVVKGSHLTKEVLLAIRSLKGIYKIEISDVWLNKKNVLRKHPFEELIYFIR